MVYLGLSLSKFLSLADCNLKPNGEGDSGKPSPELLLCDAEISLMGIVMRPS